MSEHRPTTRSDDASWRAREERRQMSGVHLSQRELRERGFVGVADALSRCWCGRPQRDSTGACKLGHEWPHI